MQIENESTLRHYLSSGFSLFLGSGFSVLSSDVGGKKLPVAEALASELRERFNKDSLKTIPLAQLCTIIDSTDRDNLKNYLKNRFTVSSYDFKYNVLTELPIATIFTTNIDSLIQEIYKSSPRYYVNDINLRGPVFKDKSSINLMQLHGSVLDDSRPYRFGVLNIAEAVAVDQDKWRYLQLQMSRNPIIFWGYALQDAGTLQALAEASRQSHSHQELWALVRKEDVDQGTIEFFKALRIQTIIGDTEEFLDYLKGVAESFDESSGKDDFSGMGTHALFPNEAIPALGTTPLRPLEYFFAGLVPTWSDIYSGRIYKTMYYSGIKNKINDGKNVIVIGIPASGKTTLLMQIAADIEYKGHKLFLQTLTPEKSNFIINRLAGQKALIFIDNCTDSVDSLSTMLRSKNIQIVACDRDYNVFTVIHRILSEKFEMVNVTDLERMDYHECVQRMPPEHRKRNFIYPVMTSNIKPSLFEIVELNSRRPNIRERFRTMLKHLYHHDIEGLELVLMTAYVHSCRTPVSMDMLIAYWRDENKEYTDILNLIERIGNSLSEYTGEFADEEQDYFSMRSNLVSEAILDEANLQIMKKIIEKCYNNISPSRICRYDVFRRKAYDADLFVRLYPNWEDGKSFYDNLYSRDCSPYNLQQAALYLSRKGKYKEAFGYIDMAVSNSGGKNWSIKNSHAIVLFRANIAFAGDEEARLGLDQSMRILAECYRSDRRKPFHAMTFADFALQYNDYYRDSIAVEYLCRAEEWLSEILRDSLHHRDCYRLKERITKRLAKVN